MDATLAGALGSRGYIYIYLSVYMHISQCIFFICACVTHFLIISIRYAKALYVQNVHCGRATARSPQRIYKERGESQCEDIDGEGR